MPGEPTTACRKSIDAFNRHEQRADGERIVLSLDAGLSLLSELFYERIRFDVERHLGSDSMLVPLSEMKSQQAANLETEVFQVVEAAGMIRAGQYIADHEWCLKWLAEFRLAAATGDAQIAGRLAAYEALQADDRRLALMDVLMKVVPESRRAPLILFRLMPLAIHLATAVAFGDATAAAETRRAQTSLLTEIADCRTCRGAVLDNGQLCAVCSNPLWNYQWLTATD
jgi:hypothetical protein